MKPRSAALQVLLQTCLHKHSLTAALEAVDSHDFNERDRAFVQALCYGVCRYYPWLDFVAQRLLDKALRRKDTDIYLLLLIGIYQLHFMSVKQHAVVAETVAAASYKPWAKGLVNAVLRNFLRQRETLSNLAENDPQARYAHARWMLDTIRENWSDAVEDICRANNEAAPMVLRVNLLQYNKQAYLELLHQADIDAEDVTLVDTAIQLVRPVTVDRLPGFAAGACSVQDTAAQLAAHLLDVRPGQRVLDLCAAPGGKTAAILERQPGLAGLTAVDVDAKRLEKLKDNLQRLQLKAEVVEADAGQSAQWGRNEHFDRILLDAPCSAFGVIRRHPDIKLLRRPDDIEALQRQQRRLLTASWDLLKPAGILLYATCSILKRENEDQIAAFVREHPDAEEVKIAADWGRGRPYGRQILTGYAQMDGFYYAKLKKKSG